MATRVKKLDDPTVFADIPTGLTQTNQLTSATRIRYNAIFNQLQERKIDIGQKADNILWLADAWPQAVAFIEKTYAPPSSPSTLRAYIEMVANVLLAIDKVKFKETTRPLFLCGRELQQEINEEADESKLSPQDIANFVSYKDLVRERDRQYDRWTAHPSILKYNMSHLVLALNTYIPPLRLDWLSMAVWPPRIVGGQLVAPTITNTPPPDDSTNYIWENPRGQWTIVMNTDKIEAHRRSLGLPRQLIPLLSDIPTITDGGALCQIIDDSLAAHPRNYVLIGIRGKGTMGAQPYNNLLHEMFAPKHPHQNLIRKAYIAQWHQPNTSHARLKEIASRMRHTAAKAIETYRKINIPADVVPAEPQPPLEAKPRFNPAAYAREYRAKNPEETAAARLAYYQANKPKIQLAKILGQLNSGQSTRPMAATIAKYSLVQDPVTRKWSGQIVAPSV